MEGPPAVDKAEVLMEVDPADAEEEVPTATAEMKVPLNEVPAAREEGDPAATMKAEVPGAVQPSRLKFLETSMAEVLGQVSTTAGIEVLAATARLKLLGRRLPPKKPFIWWQLLTTRKLTGFVWTSCFNLWTLLPTWRRSSSS